MMIRRTAALSFAALALLAGCRRNRPATPAPASPTTAADTAGGAGRARAQSEADSLARIERAERARRDQDATRRAETERRAATLARVRQSLIEPIFFEYDSDQLSAEAQERLRAKATVLLSNPEIRLRIEGHADERGSTEYNVVLGQRRAEQVRSYLVGFGIPTDRLVTLSYGEERPLEGAIGEQALARNRRAEFAIVGGEVTAATEGGA